MTMKNLIEARCVVCQLAFCCSDCRWQHEKLAHGLTYDCPICRGNRFLCRPEQLNDEFIQHLSEEHLPLQCRKCNKTFKEMEDLLDIDECTSISELVDTEIEVKKATNEVENRFDSIYEKAVSTEGDNFEAIVSVNKSSKTAVITPIVRKKHLVDYESSDTDIDSPKSAPQTPHPKLAPKTPKLKRQRAATPHAKKFLSLMRQKVVEEYDDMAFEEDINESPISNSTTPSRNNNINIPDTENEITTPTSHIHVVKLAQAVTTSTPTNSSTGGWSLFPEQGADSPLSEIENAESPAQSIDKEASKTNLDAIQPKLKSIIVTGSRIGLSSQDSSEKHVSFLDSATTETSVKTKKVKFADDTVFEQEPKIKRVFRKPKRMLTPGPRKPKSYHNPRFQALLNRFESQAITLARTPINTNREVPQEDTPPVVDHNLPARAINFKEDSPTIDSRNNTKESNDSYKTCVDSPDQPINNAITALTTNIAGSLQTCLNSVLRTTEEETEIQFKFVITKKKVSVKRIVDDGDGVDEKMSEIDREPDHNKENIWSTVARAVKNVFWGDHGSSFTVTPYKSTGSLNSTSSSASKRKFEDLSDSDLSPLNHKRHKYEGRIRGRPPLQRSKTWGVAGLRSSKSDEQHSLMRKVSSSQDDEMNQSF
ncbi:uncharacterized protein fs(1)Ya [Epargyreus clarus]|uniref:uncharacterized protein fs(1)Ya n=1 Tax=Epargyreus clarus TaxID=520877 RepID=UPI003C2CBB5E